MTEQWGNWALTDKEREKARAKLLKGDNDQRIYDYRNQLVLSAKTQDNPFGFADYYEIIHGKEMPEHDFYEWIVPTYWAAGKVGAEEVIKIYSRAPEYKYIIDEIKDQFLDIGLIPRGIVIEAFRGSTKTTTVTITFATFRIGHEPHKANLLIQVGDDIATDNTRQIADIIENNPGWKQVFPDVVPDRDMGWGASGYEVKLTHDRQTGEELDYTAWRALNSKRKDPTLVGVSYKSSQIIGKHPDGLLVIDDIHDDKNTTSQRELNRVRQVLLGTIFPTMTPETWKIFIGTPWNEGDTLHYVSSTGEFLRVTTTARRNGKPVWPEKFPEKELLRIERLVGSREFARMYMCDLSYSKNRVFRYMTYPSSEIKFNLPMVGGVDYAGTMDEYTNKAGRNDYFAMAYTAKLPGYGAVVVDGILEHCTQAEGEVHVKKAQAIFPIWLQAVVEGDGAGEVFIQTLKRNPGLRIVPMKTKGRGKGRRLEGFMAPWLENGTLRVSDAETPFLNELRHELDTYPDCEYDDALDALYWSMRGMPDVFVMRDQEEELPVPGVNGNEQAAHPYCSLGRK